MSLTKNAWLVVFSIFVGCGGEDEKKQTTLSISGEVSDLKIGDGKVFLSGSDTFQLTFLDGIPSQSYGVFPYYLGQITSAGASSVTSGVVLEGFSFSPSTSRDESIKNISYNSVQHNYRTILNRFRPDLGKVQSEGFWEFTEAVSRRRGLNFSKMNRFGRDNSLVSYLEKRISQSEAFLGKSVDQSSLTQEACPSSIPSILPSDPNIVLEDGETIVGTGYCIVKFGEPSGILTEPNDQRIVKSVETLLQTYKQVFYSSESFAPIDGYKFEPIIAIIDFEDDSLWPNFEPSEGGNELFKIAGAFVAESSTLAARPIIYMPADIRLILGDSTSESQANALWHSTLAHELHHAVVDYFRVRSSGRSAEIVSVDEGLSHLMEDIFGYGAENFSSFAGEFLALFASSGASLFSTNDNPVSRGTMQSFLYYLANEQGGFDFTNGTLSGGGGVSFIRDLVLADSAGPEAVNSATTIDLATSIGNFFATVALDNFNDSATSSSSFQLPEPKTISDLHGTGGKVFGLRFNRFGSIMRDVADYSNLADLSAESSETSPFATTPYAYNYEDNNKEFSISIKGAENFGVAVVRLN